MIVPWWAVAAAVAILAAAGAIGYWKSRKTPEERERLRRLGINARGRITDGYLLETMNRDGRRVVFYEYSVSQVTYNAAQDISSIAEALQVEGICDGVPARIKYDPQNPGDSIIACEDWSGI